MCIRDRPQTQFPRAMFLAALISFGLFTLGALAVAIITPYDPVSYTHLDVSVFCHNVELWFTPDGESRTRPKRHSARLVTARKLIGRQV